MTCKHFIDDQKVFALPLRPIEDANQPRMRDKEDVAAADSCDVAADRLFDGRSHSPGSELHKTPRIRNLVQTTKSTYPCVGASPGTSPEPPHRPQMAGKSSVRVIATSPQGNPSIVTPCSRGSVPVPIQSGHWICARVCDIVGQLANDHGACQINEEPPQSMTRRAGPLRAMRKLMRLL
jgi:hypothetical protein